MKFSDGFWLNQKGFEVNYASEAYETVANEDSISILATPYHISNRGQTLAGPILDINFSSKNENVIKVTIDHYKGVLNKGPHFEINEDKNFKPQIINNEDYAELISGKTRVRISKKGGWLVEYFYGDKKLTSSGWRTTSVIKEDKFRMQKRLDFAAADEFWSYPQEAVTSYIREQLSLSVGECIYGFGEKFSTFVKNGQTVDVWNSDGGTCSEQSYKSIPFYVSSREYGVFVNHPEKVSFEVASETVSRVSFSVPGEHLEYFIIGGENLTEVISNYTTLTGKPALPPAFTFGLWLTTSFTTKYDEETVTSFIDGMAERKIPLQVFHFDCFWMKEYEWCNFEWDTRQFPDPKGMLSRLKQKGLSICVWINPYIAQRSKLFDEGVKGGYFIKNPDGSVFQTDMWQPGMAIVDFTNPAACEWYASKLRVLCEMGVDCFKTDFGERIPTKAVYFDGSDPVKMHNYYTYLYNQTVFNVLKEYYGENKACLFARSATAGSQKFPVHWGGDCTAEYSSMAETIRGGLSLCLSGFGYFSHDISGFESTATPDIYKRWAAFGLFSSHSRLHGNSSYRVPWLFDEESCDVLRFFTELKGKLMPYIFAQAVKTSTVGIPMMRAMVMEYASDPACLYLDKQYMFGDNILVAPILNETGDAEYYLPEGTWTNIISGKEIKGGRYIREKHDYFSIPALAKPNSIVAYGDFKGNFEYDYLDGANFVIYALEDGKTASTTVYDKDANKIFELSAARKGNKIQITHTPTEKAFTVTVSNGPSAKISPNSHEAIEINL